MPRTIHPSCVLPSTPSSTSAPFLSYHPFHASRMRFLCASHHILPSTPLFAAPPPCHPFHFPLLASRALLPIPSHPPLVPPHPLLVTPRPYTRIIYDTLSWYSNHTSAHPLYISPPLRVLLTPTCLPARPPPALQLLPSVHRLHIGILGTPIYEKIHRRV
jgi:hypothetical protein